jgi:NRPS condensation-like uncharacterized protein
MLKQTTYKNSTQYVPCEIRDECHVLWDLADKQSPIYYCSFFIKERIHPQIMKSALSASLKIHDKSKYMLLQKAPSWKRWFRFFWESHEVDTSDILKVLTPQNLDIELTQKPQYYVDFIYKQRIDISKEAGIKVLLINQKEDNLLIFAFHHAITDARGALNFVETFISKYNEVYFGERIDRTQQSGNFTYCDNLVLPTWKRQSSHILKSFFSILRHQYPSRREPLITLAPKSQVLGEEKMVIVREIEGEQLERIVALAKKKSVRFTDVLLAGVYFAVKKWNSRSGGSAGRISLYSTVGLRPRDNKSLGNFASGMVINFSTKENLDKTGVLEKITKQRDFLLKHSSHLLSLSLLSICRIVPIGIRQWILEWGFKRMRSRQNTRLTTMRVTNLGTLEAGNLSHSDESILGDAQLERFCFYPIVYEPPLLLFLTYNKKIFVNLMATTSTFSYDRGEEFLHLLVRELSQC